MQQMDLWDGGKWSALVDNTKAGVLGQAGQNWTMTQQHIHTMPVSCPATYNLVRQLSSCSSGGVLQPDDTCPKMVHLVLAVLWEKHPHMCDLTELSLQISHNQ